METENKSGTENKLTAGETLARQIIATRIKKIAIRKLKVNIFFFILGAGAGFFGLTYSGALNIDCLAEKGYAPHAIVKPYNNMLLKIKTRLNG